MTRTKTQPAPAAGTATRDLILVLADTKRLLGTRYAEWILGAPELETGIACASMAQDEWGHARLLYALLKEFGDDVDKLEHGREAPDYRNHELLDSAPSSWPELVVLNALLDTAITTQLEALTESEHAPLRQRVGKLIEEEHFHSAHGIAWARRLATTHAGKQAFEQAVQAALPVIARWFGAQADAMRERWYTRIAPAITSLAIERPRTIDFHDFNESTRRVSSRGPDPETIARIRGDKNRAFLMD